ncbi:hypothetical protein LCGC14_3056680, partial [marine sediment metagenome]
MWSYDWRLQVRDTQIWDVEGYLGT